MENIIDLPLVVTREHAEIIEELAFKHLRSGVGHYVYSPGEDTKDTGTAFDRLKRGDDPGQPAECNERGLVAVQWYLAEAIEKFSSQFSSTPSSRFTVRQALVFADVAEGWAFCDAYHEADKIHNF